MASFTEVRFPTDISMGATGGAKYSTDIIENFAGYEQRNINWSKAKGKWTIGYTGKTKAQMTTLMTFFHARRGKAIGFRFKDFSDFSATNQDIGTGNAVKTAFQLRKVYSNGGDTVYRDIKKPVSGTVQVYLNGVLKTVTTHYTIDHTTGIITFLSAPGNGVAVTASYEFDVPVRFDTDEMDVTAETRDTFNWGSIAIVELKI